MSECEHCGSPLMLTDLYEDGICSDHCDESWLERELEAQAEDYWLGYRT